MHVPRCEAADLVGLLGRAAARRAVREVGYVASDVRFRIADEYADPHGVTVQAVDEGDVLVKALD